MLGTPEVAALPAAYTGENTQHEKGPRGHMPSPESPFEEFPWVLGWLLLGSLRSEDMNCVECTPPMQSLTGVLGWEGVHQRPQSGMPVCLMVRWFPNI